jgi:hypothetical protein
MLKKSLLLMLLMALLVPWAAKGQSTLPVYETGTETNEFVPFYGWYGDEVQTNQMIYPADQLTAMVGGSISQMVFFWDSQYGSNTLCNWVVKMGTTTATTLSGIDNTTALTQVYSGAMSFDATEQTMTLVFDNAFVYNGGNLLIQFNNPVTNSSAYHRYTFLGVEASGASYCYSAQRDFLPRVTFTYEVLTEPWISLNPSAATVFTGFTQELTATYGNVTGTPTIIYSSSNSKVASVTGSGTTATVTGVSAGTATITATMVYNATNYYATCDVTVEEPSYCSPYFSTPSDDHITNFTTTGGSTNINNSSTYETGGYSDYYATASASIEAGETLSCTVTPSSTSWSYGHAIWVDWNKNYEFETDERVAYSTSAASGNWTGEFEVPSTTAAGDYRMRVIHLYNNTPTNPCMSNSNYGEGEDYKLTVFAANPYQKPTDLTITNLGPFNATIGWTAPSTDVVNYQYQYMPEGGDWTAPKTTTALTAPLSGLTAETDYTFRVQAIYAGGESDFATKEFSTDVACETPTSFNVTAEATSAQITWEGTATTYNLRYRQIEPVNVTLTAGDVWGDNSGYQMLLDADATAYDIGIADYSIFEYKIPVDADNDTYTTHMVFENSITIQIPGGTYDWFITNPSPGDQVWIAGSNGNVGGRQDDYVFEGGKTYEFVPSKYGSGDGVDVTITGEAVTPGAWTTVNGISGKSYTIPTLAPSSFYEVQVQAVCGGIYGESNWVSTSFSTPASCVAPENLAVDPTSITAYGATFTWTAEATDEFQYCYVKDATPSYTPAESEFKYNVTGATLTIDHDFVPDSDYRFYLRRNCGGGDYSSIVSVAFHTDLSCYPPTDVTVDESNITATTAIIEWTSSADNFDLRYSALPDGTEYTYDNGTMASAFKNCYGGVMFPAGEFTNNHIQKVTLFDYGTSVATGELYIYNGGTTAPEDLVYYSEIIFEGTNDFADYFVDATIDNTKNVWVVVHFATSESVWKIAVCANTGDANGRWFSTDGTTWADLVDYGSSYDYTWMIRATVDDGSEYSWVNKTSTETTYPINALTPSTNYVAQVRTNCGIEDGVSTWVTTLFTTMDLCPEPQNLTVSDETPHGATFSWTDGGSETEWHLYVSTENNAPADDINLKEVTVADSNPFTLTTGLDPETNYYVWVRANCGGDDGYSSWVGPVTFTTDVACPVPTDFAVDNTSITGHEATLTWTGTSGNYNVEYRTAAYVDGLYEEFATTSLPTGWTRYSGALNPDGTGSTTTSNYSWYIGTNQFSSIHAYMNVYSTNKYWLVTPSVTIGNDYAMSFDVAYTYYNSTSAAQTTGTDDRFCVLISTDEKAHWTILREWNNAGTGDAVLNDIPATFQTINDIDISSYKGQTVYFAFYGESTTSNADNSLRIDNVMIGTPVAAGAWTSKSTTDETITLTGLLAETKYDTRVQSVCGGTDGSSAWSDIISFTTDIACYPATGLAYDNLKSNRVDLTWTSEADAWVLAYKLAADDDFTELNLTTTDVTIEGTNVTYQLTGLTAEKEYAVKVRNNCGGGDLSAWTNVITFETLADCAQPTDVTVSNIGHYTADVAWTGDSEYYILQYRTAAYLDGMNEEFATTSVPTGWTRYSGALNPDGTGPTSTVNSGWSFGTNEFSSIHAYMNMYSTWKYWLVTPSIEIAAGCSFSFDVAYTAYNSTSAAGTTGTDDRFCVLISTDEKAHWTILREWNNDGTGDAVLNDIPTTFQTISDIDLSAYKGQTVYIAFYGGSTASNTDNTLRIDNVMVGTPVPAGSWQTLSPNPTTTAANLTGLSIGTKYDVTVAPSCDATLVSDAATFTTLADMIFLTEGEWGDATNWLDNLMPTIDDNVQLQANATIASTDVAEAAKITLNGKTLTINDGGQLKTNNTVTATVKKHITGYTPAHTDEAIGYYLIANPLNSTIYSSSFASIGLTSGTYDLYSWSYNASDGKEWINSKDASYFYFYTQTGYLYANESDVDLTFMGTVAANNTDVTKSLNYSSTSYAFNGWNLVGNPFACNAYIKDATIAEEPIAFYRMNSTGDDFEVATGAIKPMEGIFVKATASGQSFTFTRTNPDTDNGTGNLNISVAENVNSRDAHASTDNAIVRFGNANTLEKFSFRENSTKMYIPQDSKKYAVVSAEASGTLPLNLKVEKTGSYTISFSNEDVEFTYLHLIDGITGEDIDLLVEDSYTFNASVRDRENRFTLVFNSIDSNIDATSDIFVYQNDDQIVVSGEGELQVYDVMGRYVGSYNVNGTETLNASQFANNVYIFRLVGETVKTQKIVVR